MNTTIKDIALACGVSTATVSLALSGAKGEVVVIDENFGVRVTDIVSPSERLSKMGNQ